MSVFDGINHEFYAIQNVPNSGVKWENPDGSVSSASLDDVELAAWLEAGNKPAATQVERDEGWTPSSDMRSDTSTSHRWLHRD